MERSTVLIVGEQAEFARQISSVWHTELNCPVLAVCSLPPIDVAPPQFDLAIVGPSDRSAAILQSLLHSRKPIIQVSVLSENAAKLSAEVISIPQVAGWPELVVAIAQRILDRDRARVEVGRLAETKAHLEREASLGRYVLEVRHNLNNALTSILGNSELMLMEPDQLTADIRQQVETIRNMGMRMNEILQRFSSLQKEMQLVDDQRGNKLTKSASASA